MGPLGIDCGHPLGSMNCRLETAALHNSSAMGELPITSIPCLIILGIARPEHRADGFSTLMTAPAALSCVVTAQVEPTAVGLGFKKAGADGRVHRHVFFHQLKKLEDALTHWRPWAIIPVSNQSENQYNFIATYANLLAYKRLFH